MKKADTKKYPLLFLMKNQNDYENQTIKEECLTPSFL